MLKRLSLTKQLLAVFCILTVLFFAVAIPIINYNLNVVIDDKMYEEIKNDQEMLADFSGFNLRKGRSPHSYHLLYDHSEDAFDYSLIANRNYFFAMSMANFMYENDLQTIIDDSKHRAVEGKCRLEDNLYYYRIVKLEAYSDTYLITLMPSSYSDSLINAFRNRVIYFQFAFLGFVAAVMMVWVLSLISPLKRITHYVEGITEGHASELEIDRRDEIGIVGRAVVHMNEELAKQAHIKEEMIHNISHDLKTPIALIKTYGQSVKDDIYPYGDKDASMDVILENADRLERRVKDLLYLNRLDYLFGEDQEVTPFDMKELIEHIVMQMDALSSDIKLETSLDDVVFMGNPEHWRVAIENIIDNATRYAKSLIRIDLKNDHLVIYNDGEAIDEEIIGDLFDPYVKGVKGQFGLGLSIVSKTAQMYGYQVYARNEPEGGVAFVFTRK